jgi:hypothetical protein
LGEIIRLPTAARITRGTTVAVTTATATTAAEAVADDRTTEAGGLAANAAIELESACRIHYRKKVNSSSEGSLSENPIDAVFFISIA